MTHTSAAVRIGLLLAVYATGACAHPTVTTQSRAPQAAPGAPLLELWSEPSDLETRDLLVGSAPLAGAPLKNVQYMVKKRDTSGYSKGYDVTGPDGRDWDVKVGKEAQTEIVLSRILWALGYHQPATYYMTDWQLAGTYDDEGQPARFRLQSDHETEGEWKWLDNPFAESRPMHGLIAINALLSNWDFKTSNNRVYRMTDAKQEIAKRYVVQDLGASLGKPRVFPIPIGTRNEIEDFEGSLLIKEVKGSRVVLNFRSPLHRDILERLTVDDIVWACELMNRLADAQLDDAFEAAGYTPDIRSRYVTKIRAKIREGLALRSTLNARVGD
jgi:hypothetical protein